MAKRGNGGDKKKQIKHQPKRGKGKGYDSGSYKEMEDITRQPQASYSPSQLGENGGARAQRKEA